MKFYQKLSWPYFIWSLLLILLPILLIGVFAFTNQNFVFSLQQFYRFFNPLYFKVLVNSLKIALKTTLITILIAYPISWAVLQESKEKQNLILLLITAPMWINMIVRTYSWIGILSDVGLLNRFLALFNLGPWEIMYQDTAVILGMVYNFLPFMIIQIFTSLKEMDSSLIEASYDLGADRIKTFVKVVFPLTLPGLSSGILLVFIPSLSSFVVPMILGGGNYVLIGNVIEQQFIHMGDYHFGSAVSFILAGIMFVFIRLTYRIQRKYGVSEGV